MTSMRTRERLVSRLREEGIADEDVLDAIRDVPRHIFVDEALASRAYEDIALPIGMGQTISQPFIVALMTQATVASPTPTPTPTPRGCWKSEPGADIRPRCSLRSSRACTPWSESRCCSPGRASDCARSM